MLTLRQAGEHYVEYYITCVQVYICSYIIFFAMQFIARAIIIHRLEFQRILRSSGMETLGVSRNPDLEP